MTDTYHDHLWECALERMPAGTCLDVEPLGTVTKTDIGYWRKSGDGGTVDDEALAQAIRAHGCTVHKAVLS
jgi:hypothetical protein